MPRNSRPAGSSTPRRTDRSAMSRLHCAWGMGVIWLLAGRAAHASPSFPQTMKDALHFSLTPPCTVCHDDAQPDAQTLSGDAGIDTAFARAVVARGTVAGDEDSLRRALVAMKDVDSDGDGARDLDEISWGGDPNHADAPDVTPSAPPSYGCGASAINHRSGTRRTLLGLCVLMVARPKKRRSGPFRKSEGGFRNP